MIYSILCSTKFKRAVLAQSFYCGNAVGNQMVQVTPNEVRLLGATKKSLLHQWKPPNGMRINTAAGNASQVRNSTPG